MKHYFFYKSKPKFIKFLLNYLLNAPHITAFRIFGILKIEILTILFSFSLTWDSIGNENFKTLLFLQIAANHFQTYFESSSPPPQSSPPNYVGDFLNFEFTILNEFFVKNFKFTIVFYGETKQSHLSGT